MNSEWNHQQIEQVIDEYQKKTELLDPKNNNYHIRNKKHDAWQTIAQNIGCEIIEVKSKMTSLLSSFWREKVKIKKSMGTGKGTILGFTFK